MQQSSSTRSAGYRPSQTLRLVHTRPHLAPAKPTACSKRLSAKCTRQRIERRHHYKCGQRPWCPRDFGYRPGDGRTAICLVILARCKCCGVSLTDADARIDDLMFVDEFLAGIECGLVDLEQYFADRARYGAKRALCSCIRNQLPQCLAANLASCPSRHSRAERSAASSGCRSLTAKIQMSSPACWLRRSAAGLRASIATGSIFSPPMPQQRRSPRRLLCQPCVVQTGEHSAGAIVRDVSAGGMGLEQIPPLRPGEAVRVELSGGRRFDATVTWCSSRTAGVRFKTPLPAIDPLLLD